MQRTAYQLSALDQGGRETERLSDQARVFVDLELESLSAQLPQGGRVADFGCGSGVIAHALALLRKDLEVWGLDADAGAVEGCRARHVLPNLRFEVFALGSGQPCPAGLLDAALTRLVLLHLPDPQAALKSMAQTLKPGGRLYAVDSDDSDAELEPKPEWLGRLISLMQGVQVSRGGTRMLGGRLGGMLAGMPELEERGGSKVWYSKRGIGHSRFHGMFLPVIRFYLDQAAALGLAPPEETASLGAAADAFLADSSTEMRLCLHHAWATRR